MPELPEVETIARTLRPALIGRRILGADVRWTRTIAAPSVRKFKQDIQGQVIQDVGRRAKFIHIRLTSAHLLVHLRMSGDLQVKRGKPRPTKHDRMLLVLARAEPSQGRWRAGDREAEITSLVFNDTRKFGRVWLTSRIETVTGRLGPEPLSSAFTKELLYERLHGHRRLLKPLLLDQTFVAGLGNIYTDEALHLARLHPLKASDRVSRQQATRLYRAIRAVLTEGIRRNGASIDWVYRGGEFQNHFRVYDRRGEPCPVCGATIRRLIVGQRGTHVCPRCQRM